MIDSAFLLILGGTFLAAMISSSTNTWLAALDCGAALVSASGQLVEVNERWPFAQQGTIWDISPTAEAGQEQITAVLTGERDRIELEAFSYSIVLRACGDGHLLAQTLEPAFTTERAEHIRRIVDCLPKLRLQLWSSTVGAEVEVVRSVAAKLWPHPSVGQYSSARSWLERIHPDDRAKFLELAEKCEDQILVREYRVLDDNGDAHWVRTRATQLLNESGDVVELIGVSGDIDREVAARNEVDKLGARLELVLEGSRDGFWDWDVEHDEMFLSARTLELLGYRRSEVASYGDWLVESLHPDDVEAVQDQIVATLKGLSSFFRTEVRARNRDGQWTWIAARGKVVERDDNGRARRFAGTVCDISERRQLEDQLFQSQKMDSFGRMAGGIAHDFNNLVTGVMGYAELLQLRLAGDPRAAYVGEIVKAAQRAGDLTSKLLDFARKRVVEPRVIDVGEVIEDLRPMLQRLIGEDIQLSPQLAEDLHAVRLDPSQFEQILINLAVNARDAMPNGGQITVATGNVLLDREYVRSNPDATEGPHVVLVVTDTGCGMDEATKWRVFEPFFTTKTPGKGTGLGLATCYGIVVQAGGHLRVFSEPGTGASFRLYFPAIDAPSQPPREASGPHPSIPGMGQLILLVEDEEIVRKVLHETLTTHGYRVIAAVDGVDALEKFSEHGVEIELILTDLVMPRMNGRELADQVRKAKPETKIMFMSGYVEDVVSPDDDRILSKPFSSTELLDRISEAVG
ncbi:MAG: two-component system cell cycle sensor histidine kinase/response regulator CckA [Bradymonadia bacterium]